MCQLCHTLSHEFYGLSDKVCDLFKCDKKTYQNVIVEGKLHPLFVTFLDLNDNGRSTSCCLSSGTPHIGSDQACDQAKEGRSQAEGSLLSSDLTLGVQGLASPSPPVAKVTVPVPPITVPSQATCPPLFKEPVVSGDEDVRNGGPATSGASQNTLLTLSD